MPVVVESLESICLHVRKNTNQVVLDEFTKQQDNKIKRYAIAKKCVPDSVIQQVIRFSTKKDAQQAIKRKTEGNAEFKAGHWLAAIERYNLSALTTPADNVADFATILGNRSASLLNLKLYKEAFDDIKRAEQNYPAENLFKLIFRKGKVLMGLNDYGAALIEYKRGAQLVLDHEKLPESTKRNLLEEACHIIKFLQRNSLVNVFVGATPLNTTPISVSIDNNNNNHTNSQTCHHNNTTNNIGFTNGHSSLRNCQSSANGHTISAVAVNGATNGTSSPKFADIVHKGVQIKYNEIEGRHAVAGETMDAGDLVLKLKPYAAVLDQTCTLTHCDTCSQRCSTVKICCENCTDVIYCSYDCKSWASTAWHQYECGYMNVVKKCKLDLALRLALRIMTVHDADFYCHMIGELDVIHWTLNQAKNGYQTKGLSYCKLFGLVSHESTFSSTKLFEFNLIAKLLVELLKATNYFISLPGGLTNEVEDYFGAIIVHHLLILHFNAHEIFESHKTEGDKFGKAVAIGGAIYPHLALFNHSCDPNTGKYFIGSTVHVRTTKVIRVGEQIYENYGPFFTQNNFKERQLQLREKFKFDCECPACKNQWPLLKNIKDDNVDVKCAGYNMLLLLSEKSPTLMASSVNGMNGASHQMLKNVSSNGYHEDMSEDKTISSSQCTGIISLPLTSTSSNDERHVVQCSECGCEIQVGVVKARLKMIDQVLTEVMATNGAPVDANTALTKLWDVMKWFEKLIVPPYSRFYMCQREIRKFYEELGNQVTFKAAVAATTDENYFM